MITASVKALPIGRHATGSTLSEVLVSLAIMSIGVISLASIFPISVLRSLQATQLTNATNLRYNAEALTNIKPELYTIAPPWQPSTTYTVGQIVVAMPLTALKQPPAIFQCTYVDSTNPRSGLYEPFWRFDGNATIESTGMRWQSYELKNYVIDPLGEAVDPSGAQLVETAFRTPSLSTDPFHYLGNSGSNKAWTGSTQTLPSGQVINWPGIYAFSGLGTSPSALSADDVAGLQDSWITQAESSKLTISSTSCVLDNIQPSGPLTLSITNVRTRLVFFDDSGKRSYQREVTSLSSSPTTATAGFSPALPAGFAPTRATLETKERRYTWMLAVRRAFSGTTQIDVVVFFRRTFSGEDETVYPATFIATTDYGSDLGPGINGVNNTLGWPGSDDTQRNWVILQYNKASGKPFLKKGGFVTDVDNLRFYRITDFFEADTAANVITKAQIDINSINPTPFAGPAYVPDGPTLSFGSNVRYVLIKVDSPIFATGHTPANAGAPPEGRAMLMRGIVDVYPIRARQAWETK